MMSHQLGKTGKSFAISVAMVSLIKQKELHEMQPTDYAITGDEKVFLEEQLKYYFEFSDNRWNLNVIESQLDVSFIFFRCQYFLAYTGRTISRGYYPHSATLRVL